MLQDLNKFLKYEQEQYRKADKHSKLDKFISDHEK